MSDEITHEEKQQLDSLEAASRASVPRLDNYRALELNADYQPLSYNPLSVQPWFQVMFWLVKGWNRERNGEPPIIRVLETYPGVYVHASSMKIELPSVIIHTKMIKLKSRVAFNKFNLFLRDNFTCQYTGKKLPVKQLTFDHIIPESQGGLTTWDNIVACSNEINHLKGNMSLDEFTKRYGYRLIKEPKKPDAYEIREKSKKIPPQYLHESWQDYLYWDTELESRDDEK